MSRRALPVLASTDDWIVVAKPPWLLVHRDALSRYADAALQRVRNQTGGWVSPIHRLDRQVSGCLLFARNAEWAGPLSRALTDPGARKQYVALVRGTWKRGPEPVVVDTPMKDDNGILKEARSTVTPIAWSTEPRCSLLLVEPHTGRYHQVRRHVRDLDHPIIGDTKHGDSHVNREWREQRGMRRVALHCLSLHVPLTGFVPPRPDTDAADEAAPGPSAISVTSPLFSDLADVLRGLPFFDEAAARLPALSLPALPSPPPPAQPGP
jgi:tRNA pseudouridine65 synthase